MSSIVKENAISFKELEQKIFRYVCELGREITSILLNDYDDRLAENRDRKIYRDKGKRPTTIKTVYGEVPYARRVYQTLTEKGETAYIYLLDEAMQMEKIGLISTNLAERVAMTVTEAPYRVTSDVIGNTSGQSLSPMGIWNLMQRLGEQIDKEEDAAVCQMNAGQSTGEEAPAILFEEMDGVWLSMQDKRHKRQKKQEMKVFTMYEGWDAEKEKEGRSSLVGKRMLAGMEDSKTFHQKREALIRQTYDVDEIGQRVLNGDGGSWIKEEYDPEAIFQLDRYHIHKEITRRIKDRKARAEIQRLFAEEKPDEMLEYIQVYATSVESDDETDTRSKDARKLYEYLNNNKSGLLSWQSQMGEVPKPEKGLIYKNMGVQENQNCTAVTMRMKHRRMRWSVRGANNMGKALYRKENKELAETIERFSDGLILTLRMQEIVEVLSAAKAPQRDGKGNPYVEVWKSHMPLLDALQTVSRKAFAKAVLGA